MPVSIIIPCFNRENMIGEAIESALGQGEIIVVDDGSTDGSWGVIQSYPVRAIRTANRGVGHARAVGVREASGDYVRFLDSDDRLVPGSTKALMAQPLGPQQIAVGDATDPSYGFPKIVGKIPADKLLFYTMPCGLPLFPRHAAMCDESLRVSEDYELAARLHSEGYEFIKFPLAVYEPRGHGGHRLTRDPSSFAETLVAFRKAAEYLSPSERTTLGRKAWNLAREASRRKIPVAANDLFAFALSMGGTAVRGKFDPLYRLLPPYSAERVLEFVKSSFR